MVTRRTGLMVVLAATALAAPGVAAAQDPDEPVTSDEIVVTAQKREERLADVPIAITAITPEVIEERGVSDLTELQAAIPSLRMVDIGPGSQRIQLRGVAQYQGLPTVGNYVDEFSVNPEGASGGAEVRLLDLARVEVLRGPQAVLYGEGSMGGTIRYITARPDLDQFGGQVLVEGSSPDDGDTGYRAEGVLNIPIQLGVAGIRIAVADQESPGWIDGPNGDDLNGVDSGTVRATMLVQPTDRWTIELMAMNDDREQDYKSYSFDGSTTTQIVPSIAEQDYTLATLNISHDFGPVTLLSATGAIEQGGRSVDDSARFYNELFGAPLLTTAVTDSQVDSTRWSQEFRLSSNGEARFRWLAGVSYSEAENMGVTPGEGTTAIVGLDPASLGVVFDFNSATSSEVWAAYATVSYDLTERLILDAGGRYFADERTLFSRFQIPFFGLDQVNTGSDTFNTFNPRVALTYHAGEDGIFYGSISKGFRSGGFNAITGPGVPATYDPETLWTGELGLKQSFADGRVYWEMAVYYNDYSDIQSNAVVPPGFAAVLNSGSASGPGVDLLLRLQPTDRLTVTGTVGYNHMRFDTAATDKAEGDPLDLVPDWNASLAIDYSRPIAANIDLNARLDIDYTDQATITLRQLSEIESSDPRTLANARVALVFGNTEVYAFANNITDEARIVNPAFGAFFEPIYTRPRTIGLGVRADF